MKQITEQQAVECMAEMMGKCVHDWRQVVPDAFGVNKGRKRFQCTKCKELCFIRLSLPNPLYDANHALECLEAYCDNPRLWKQGGWWHVVILENDVYKDPWQASHPDLNHAVITALCSAQMGEQVEIEG